MVASLLYVSRSLLFIPNDENVVHEIVALARGRNRSLGVTGAMIFTQQHFAQYLEGEEVAIADLMASIRRDPRHTDIELVMSAEIGKRRFTSWDMAYAGPSLFVGRQVEALIGGHLGDASNLSAERVLRLMSEFARHTPFQALQAA